MNSLRDINRVIGYTAIRTSALSTERGEELFTEEKKTSMMQVHVSNLYTFQGLCGERHLPTYWQMSDEFVILLESTGCVQKRQKNTIILHLHTLAHMSVSTQERQE